MADKPEILISIKTVIQIKIIINPAFRSIAKRKPKDVATPLPPLNLLKIGVSLRRNLANLPEVTLINLNLNENLIRKKCHLRNLQLNTISY